MIGEAGKADKITGDSLIPMSKQEKSGGNTHLGPHMKLQELFILEPWSLVCLRNVDKSVIFNVHFI